MNENWSRNLQEAAEKVQIKTSAELHRAITETGLKIVSNTVWRWWTGQRRPSTKEQHEALDVVLKIENSEKLFFFER